VAEGFRGDPGVFSRLSLPLPGAGLIDTFLKKQPGQGGRDRQKADNRNRRHGGRRGNPDDFILYGDCYARRIDRETVSQRVFLSFRSQGEIFKLLLRQFNCFIPDIPSKDGIHNEFDWMPDRVRQDVFDTCLPM